MQDNQKTAESELEWELWISPRARYARLQVKPYGGLEVVIPPRFPRREIPYLVEQHAAWARRQLERQARLRQAVRLPRQLLLAFDDSRFDIDYPGESLCHNYDRFDRGSDSRIQIEAGDADAQRRELRAWIRQRARALLPPLLGRIAADTGLEYRKVTIRSQKTRWGSCSRRGSISLNDQLLFLPAAAVEYLMIHELCHTRHMNHSRAFWQLVERHCADYRAHEKMLSQPRGFVPDWFLLDLYS